MLHGRTHRAVDTAVDTATTHSQVDCRHQSAQNCPLGYRKQPLCVSLLALVRREIVHVFRALVSQVRSMLSLARRGEAAGRPADRATRENEGHASSREPDKHRGRRHRLSALLLASWAAACMSARRRARARPRPGSGGSASYKINTQK
jgi:hypothetical protein